MNAASQVSAVSATLSPFGCSGARARHDYRTLARDSDVLITDYAAGEVVTRARSSVHGWVGLA